MNVVFVCHGNATSQSTYHVLSIAEQLVVLGHHCIVCIPSHQQGDLTKLRATTVPVRDFGQVAASGLQFPDGLGPTLIHCWTPREGVRQFAEGLIRQHDCPWFVHLEDNEREIVQRQLEGLSYEELRRLPAEEQDGHISLPLLRIHPARHWDFLTGAAGCTVLIEKLKEHVPPGVPVQLFWPGYDDCFAVAPRQSKAQLRRKHGIPENRFVVLYSGAFHEINHDEISRMVTALKILVNRGMPLAFVKTGHNDFPDLLRQGVDKGWIRELGFLPREQLPELYQMSDVLIQPGRSDPFNDYRFPSKLPEALSQKLPVILPRCNIGLVLEDGVQALITQDDSMEGLIGKIVYLYENADERVRLGEAGWRFGEQHLSWSGAARTIESFYRQCLAHPSPSGRLPAPAAAATSASLPTHGVAAAAGDDLGRPIAPEDLYQLFLEERSLKSRGSVLANVKSLRTADLSPLLAKAQRRARKYKRLYVIELILIAALLWALWLR